MARNLADIARRPNAVLKVGGVGMPVYGFGFDGVDPAALDRARRAWKPSVETAIELFGTDRCMFESNFPVDKQSFSYDTLWNTFRLLDRHVLGRRARAALLRNHAPGYELDA